MKIALVIPGGSGGGVRSVTRIAEGLSARGHDVLLLCRECPSGLHDRMRNAYLSLRYGRKSDWFRSFAGRAGSYKRLTAEVVGSQDVVVGVGVDCVLEIAALPQRCGIQIHNSRGLEPWIEERMRRAWALPMPRIVNGAHLATEMRRSGCRDPIYIAHNGVDRSQYYPAAAEGPRDGVGTVYHGGGVKDPQLILEVLRRLRSQRPHLPLYVFGVFPQPRGLPKGTSYVRFPSLAVARGLYSRSQVWFLASRNEGLPNPVLEAMACGCSVVSTECGGSGDIITGGANGFLTPVGDAEAMTARIVQLLEDEALRGRFIQGATPVLEHFTWPNAVEAFETALQAIVTGVRRYAHV